VKKSFVVWAFSVLWGAAGLAEAGVVHDLSISYSGQGTSGTALVQGVDVGGGEFDLISGTLDSTTLGHETLVVSPLNPGTAVFENSNGDEPVYDNRVFVPANASASPDGANLTYAGGLVFQTALPSKEDIYFSANYQGANNPAIYYFAGWDRASGVLDSFHVTDLGPLVSLASVPEPATIISSTLGALTVLGFTLARRRKQASV
jgi:hypothetical protein